MLLNKPNQTPYLKLLINAQCIMTNYGLLSIKKIFNYQSWFHINQTLFEFMICLNIRKKIEKIFLFA